MKMFRNKSFLLIICFSLIFTISSNQFCKSAYSIAVVDDVTLLAIALMSAAGVTFSSSDMVGDVSISGVDVEAVAQAFLEKYPEQAIFLTEVMENYVTHGRVSFEKLVDASGDILEHVQSGFSSFFDSVYGYFTADAEGNGSIAIPDMGDFFYDDNFASYEGMPVSDGFTIILDSSKAAIGAPFLKAVFVCDPFTNYTDSSGNIMYYGKLGFNLSRIDANGVEGVVSFHGFEDFLTQGFGTKWDQGISYKDYAPYFTLLPVPLVGELGDTVCSVHVNSYSIKYSRSKLLIPYKEPFPSYRYSLVSISSGAVSIPSTVPFTLDKTIALEKVKTAFDGALTSGDLVINPPTSLDNVMDLTPDLVYNPDSEKPMIGGIGLGNLVGNPDIPLDPDIPVDPPITGDLDGIAGGVTATNSWLSRILSKLTAIKDSITGFFTKLFDFSAGLNFDAFKLGEFKNVFPFCVPFDLINSFKTLVADPVVPRFEFDFSGTAMASAGKIVIDFSRFEPLAKIIRFFVFLLTSFGLIKITRNIIKG